MRFVVVQLRNNGVRLSKAEIAAAPAVVGDLVVTDWRQGNAEKRALRQAQLIHALPQYTRSLLTPLFDPVLIRMTSAWFILQGYQCKVELEHRVAHYRQEWLMRPTDAVGVDLVESRPAPVIRRHGGG